MDSLIQELEWGRRSNMLEDKDFELLEEETPVVNENEEDIEITDDDFTLTEVDSTIHEQKFQTKPTTFAKDAFRRFRKNKSSVAAAFILGTLVVLSIAVPLIDQSDVENSHPDEYYLSPKLFNAGTGFWDGTEKYKNIAVDISEMPDADTEEEKQEHWWPSPNIYKQRSAISKKKFSDLTYVNSLSNLGTFAKEGYIHFGYHKSEAKSNYVEFASQDIADLELPADSLYLATFDTYDAAKIRAKEGKEDFDLPENYVLGDTAMFFVYYEGTAKHEVKVVDFAARHDIGSAVASYAKEKVDLANIIATETGKTTFEKAHFAVKMSTEGEQEKVCALIGGISFESHLAVEEQNDAFALMSFTDASKALTKTSAKTDGYAYWSSTGLRNIYLSKAYFCSFVYDTYEATYGTMLDTNFSVKDLLRYEKNGWMSFKTEDGTKTLVDRGSVGTSIDTVHFTCKILDPAKCPITEPLTIDDFVYPTPNENGIALGEVVCQAMVCRYKQYGYSSMPRFLMGTDVSGRDMLKYVFEGLRTSLLVATITFVICFSFGVVWGSISGYFGGNVDLIMERITDILGRIPFVVLMTLLLLHWGQSLWMFVFAMCTTGWIGTASLTRTQFYRFRGREYVLASRTLGASDARLIAKHIFPNGLGTIITAEVLIIPGFIFSEANIAYLGLGLQGASSLGVILSDNQAELSGHPFLLLFPSVIIALLMISFNLFGNGLRDAVNPSLKGED